MQKHICKKNQDFYSIDQRKTYLNKKLEVLLNNNSAVSFYSFTKGVNNFFLLTG